MFGWEEGGGGSFEDLQYTMNVFLLFLCVLNLVKGTGTVRYRIDRRYQYRCKYFYSRNVNAVCLWFSFSVMTSVYFPFLFIAGLCQTIRYRHTVGTSTYLWYSSTVDTYWLYPFGDLTLSLNCFFFLISLHHLRLLLHTSSIFLPLSLSPCKMSALKRRS